MSEVLNIACRYLLSNFNKAIGTKHDGKLRLNTETGLLIQNWIFT